MNNRLYLDFKNQEIDTRISIYVDYPTEFQANNIDTILPGWDKNFSATIVILQEAKLDLTEKSLVVTKEKHRLRFNYLDFCCRLVKKSSKDNISLQPLDPRNGKALFWEEGECIHDDTEVAFLILKKNDNQIKKEYQGDCKIIVHPIWGYKNYPSIILSDATPQKTFAMLKEYLRLI